MRSIFRVNRVLNGSIVRIILMARHFENLGKVKLLLHGQSTLVAVLPKSS